MSSVDVVDFHVRPFPDRSRPFSQLRIVQAWRGRARRVLGPVTRALHGAQPWLRALPAGVRRPVDYASGLIPLPGLVVESTLDDLRAELADAGGGAAAVLAAQPPLISNEFVLEAARENPDLFAAVNVSPREARPAATVRRFVERGASALKLYPGQDDLPLDSPAYLEIFGAAAEHGLPVLVATGELPWSTVGPWRSVPATRLRPWFERAPETTFVLLHLNYHSPEDALALAEEFPRLLVETSWQPPSVIAEAVRRLGAERVLLGSDWPFLGRNLGVMIDRVRAAARRADWGDEGLARVLGGNARRVLRPKPVVTGSRDATA